MYFVFINFEYAGALMNFKVYKMQKTNISGKGITLEYIIKLARRLTPIEKFQLIEKVIPDLEAPLKKSHAEIQPLRSAYGSLSDLGPAPSDEDIKKTRLEFLSDFPREDI